MATFCTIAVVSVIFSIGPAFSIPTDGESTPLSAVPSTTAKAVALDKVKVNDNQTEIHDVDAPDVGWEFENRTLIDTRRILYSRKVAKGKRAYMVYLQLTTESAKAHKYRGWLCGGVIVHPSYVLTSAACVEDADHFYIVSGTTKFVDSVDYKSNDCVCKHRRKVVWKCIPKNYKFDFQDSIKWSSNDIAIVKVNKAFKFGVVEKGCEYATDLICYNNISRELEQTGTKGWIAGWGSTGTFREGVYRKQSEVAEGSKNAKCLQEAKVCVMDNKACAKKWAAKFRNIIEQYMICTKDVMRRLSEICDKKYANCTDVDDAARRNMELNVELNNSRSDLDLGRHLSNPDDYSARRSSLHGGFCENDHGGPLIVKYQGKERVVGVISACKIDPKSHSCHGPFLYTSVFKNRQFLSCAINKDVEESCRRVFRTGITHEEWTVDWSSVNDDDDEDGESRKEEREDEEEGSKENKDSLRNAELKQAKDKKQKSTEVASHEESKHKPAHEDKEKKPKHSKNKKPKHIHHAGNFDAVPLTEDSSEEVEAAKTTTKKEKQPKKEEVGLRADDSSTSSE